MATFMVDEDDQNFQKKLLDGNSDELNELKAFLFKENIRLEMEKKEIEELRKKLFEDRERLRKESDEVNNRIVIERQRLKQDEMFFDKKMDILKNGFEALEADRKALKKARSVFEEERSILNGSIRRAKNEETYLFLFKGVNSLLSLKKRYKDLLKIFHPDNMAGDHEMVLAINQIYEDLKKSYENNESKII